MRARFARPPGLDRAPPTPATERGKLFVAVPCYGATMTAQTVDGLIHLFLSLHHSGIKFAKSFLGNESLVTRARNRQVARFLQTDCSHLLFVDADVGFSAPDVNALMNCDEDVVFGAYPKKSYGWEAIRRAAVDGATAEELKTAGALYAVNAPSGGEVEVVEKNGVKMVEMPECSTGFMLIRRTAIEAFISRYREEIAYVADDPEHQGQVHHMVFQADRDPAAPPGQLPRYLSEDFWFCRKWQMMGGKVWLCLDCNLTHTGTHTWVGDVATLLETAVESPPEAPLAERRHRVEVEMVEPAA